MSEENIYSKSYSGFVLGSLCNNLDLYTDSHYPLNKEDFRPFTPHKTIFVCLSLLAKEGVEKVESKDIAEVLKKYPSEANQMKEKVGDYLKYIQDLIQLDNDKAYSFYYNEVRKRSLLREYRDNGYNISKFFNEDKDIESQNANLDKYSIEEIIDYFDQTQADIRSRYIIDEDTTVKKAGDGGEQILQHFAENPMMGLSFESKYLTTLWDGFRKQQLYIRSGDTSSGKSRSCVGDLANICANQIYDEEKKDFIDNPNGKNNKGLYIGCEMELNEECDPLFWAYVSGVESSKIMHHRTTTEEDKLVQKALEIVKESNIWLCDMPSFNIKKIEEMIKTFKARYDIDYVAFDYMLINTALVREFCENRGGKGAFRGDEVLLELSKNLKDIAKKYDVGILTATQTNAEIKDYRMRDYQVIRGGKAVADKATGGSISMPITKPELKLVEPYIEKFCRGFGKDGLKPNFVETVYKARFSEYPKECKIFSYYNLGNMRKKELFVTDKDFKWIDLPKTVVNIKE